VRRCPARFIAAPASGQGKTTVTLALARRHRALGRKVRVFKAGPDFLDPMVLERAAGSTVYQLDPWLGSEAHCRGLLYEAAGAADLILIEGAMGLFDGECSGADLATLFGIPVVVVIDASAMAQSFSAVAHGLVTYREALPVAGVFANRVAGERHYGMLTEGLRPGMRSLGWLGRDAEIALPERHLGLTQADEVGDLDRRIDRAADALRGTVTELPLPVAFTPPEVEEQRALLAGLRIVVARDAAFGFLYHANLDLLRSLGARIEFFSPLDDGRLPEANALYLGGGYPELHLNRLSDNLEMKAAVRSHHAAGKPIVAECGGMLYLLQSLTDVHGRSAEMAGLLPGHASMQKRLANLGLHGVELPEGRLRGHTYHYSRLRTPMAPSACSEGTRRGRPGEPVYRDGRLLASYLHLYFPSNPEAAARLFAASPASTPSPVLG